MQARCDRPGPIKFSHRSCSLALLSTLSSVSSVVLASPPSKTLTTLHPPSSTRLNSSDNTSHKRRDRRCELALALCCRRPRCTPAIGSDQPSTSCLLAATCSRLSSPIRSSCRSVTLRSRLATLTPSIFNFGREIPADSRDEKPGTRLQRRRLLRSHHVCTCLRPRPPSDFVDDQQLRQRTAVSVPSLAPSI